MRDFRREEINASRPGFAVPVTEFSWSAARHFRFETCRRAYFLHYYYAQGGWDRYADPLVRDAWSAKKRLAPSEWLDREFEKILRSSFDSLRMVPRELRMKVLPVRLAVLTARFEDSLRRGTQRDAENPETLPSPSPELAKFAAENLKRAAGDFLRSETCRVLASVQNPTVFNRAFQPSFRTENAAVWYNPGLIWREGEVLCSLRISFGEYGEAFCRLESDVFALAARTLRRSERTLSIFRHADSRGEWREHAFEGNPERALEILSSDTRKMTALLSGETAALPDFPPPGDDRRDSVCGSCRYSTVCAALSEWSGDF